MSELLCFTCRQAPDYPSTCRSDAHANRAVADAEAATGVVGTLVLEDGEYVFWEDGAPDGHEGRVVCELREPDD